MADEWWRGAVIYQIYPRSFQDSTGNGIGDLPGITSRLDHVASLGVDAIWLSPFFTSPMADMGYDVSDYCDVDPLFGTLADFDALLARAHDLGLRVIIDQVLSHTSDQHPWFQASRASLTGDKSDWYVWAGPRVDGTPPNNWPSHFGGPAWEWEPRRKQYYLHNYLTSQPDLNFHNSNVQDALLDSVNFWLERGVDGFRLDTVNYYVHDQQLRDNPPMDGGPNAGPYEMQDHIYSKTRPENIKFLKRLRRLTDKYPDRMLVGEVGVSDDRSVQVMGDYTREDDRLHMAYSFTMLGDDHSPDHFRSRIEGFFEGAPDGWPCWSFSNHDVRRHVTRWSGPETDIGALAKQSIALLACLPGTLGIYQGEELGQTETDLEYDELTDPPGLRFWPEYKGRDGCRTPMVWDLEKANAGFSEATPWLPVKPPQAARAVSEQGADNDSVLATYRRVLALRAGIAALKQGDYRFLDTPKPSLVFERSFAAQSVICMLNLSESQVTIPTPCALGDIKFNQSTVIESGSVRMEAHGCLIAEILLG